MPVQVVASATEALAVRLDGGGTRIVIIDSRLPDMRAEALLDALRARDVAWRYVLLAENEDARDDAHTQGFHAVILWPVRQSALFDVLAVAQEVDDADVSGVTEMRAVAPFPNIDPEQARKDNRPILLVEDNIMNQKVATVGKRHPTDDQHGSTL